MPRHNAPFPYAKSSRVATHLAAPLHLTPGESGPIVTTTRPSEDFIPARQGNFSVAIPKQYLSGNLILPHETQPRAVFQLSGALSEWNGHLLPQGNLDLGWKLDGTSGLTPFLSIGLRSTRTSIATTAYRSGGGWFSEATTDSANQAHTYTDLALEWGAGFGLTLIEWDRNVLVGGTRVATFALPPATGMRLTIASADMAAYLEIIENVYYSFRVGGNIETVLDAASAYGEMGLLISM